jgi:hypothetical protein
MVSAGEVILGIHSLLDDSPFARFGDGERFIPIFFLVPQLYSPYLRLQSSA